MDELKPCPFCGFKALCYETDDGTFKTECQRWRSDNSEDTEIQCPSTDDYWTKAEALAAWNRRSGEK